MVVSKETDIGKREAMVKFLAIMLLELLFVGLILIRCCCLVLVLFLVGGVGWEEYLVGFCYSFFFCIMRIVFFYDYLFRLFWIGLRMCCFFLCYVSFLCFFEVNGYLFLKVVLE